MSEIVNLLSKSSRRSGWHAFFMGWGLLVLNLVLFIVIVPSLLALLFGLSATEMQTITSGEIESGREMWLMRIFQGSNQLLTWGATGLMMGFLLGNPRKELALEQRPDIRQILLGIAIMLISLPLVAYVTISPNAFQLPAFMEGMEAWMQAMETTNQGMIEDMLGDTSPAAFIGNVVILAVLPAICEELFFRGFIQQTLARIMNPHAAVWAAAAIFSLIHLQFYGFFARTLLGGLLGYLLMGSRSLIPSMVAHFCFNFFSILLFFIAFNTDWVDAEVVMNDDYEVPILLALLSLAALIGLMMQYLKLKPGSVSAHQDEA